MNTAIFAYIEALLYFTRYYTCTGMAIALQTISHDRLTRMLNGGWCSQTLFLWVLSMLFDLEAGWLSLDDTIIEKPHSKWAGELAWGYSHTHKKPTFGLTVVLLVWSNGVFRIPIGYRVWKKGGDSKIILALELLSDTRNRLKLRPDFICFDSWYPSKTLLKRITDYGWTFICQVKKNRNFNGIALKNFKKHPYWNAIGRFSCGLKVKVVRHRRKYFATNRLSLDAKLMRKLYKKRQDVEEVFKVLKSELGAERCQAGYRRRKGEKPKWKKDGPQEHHLCLCLVTYLILERERFERGVSLRKLRQELILRRQEVQLPTLSELRDLA